MVDDGTCNYIADTPEETGLSEDLRGYMTNTLSRIWGHNFKGDETEPKDWASTGYSYRGQRVSQRDIMRLVRPLNKEHAQPLDTQPNSCSFNLRPDRFCNTLSV